MAKRTRAQRRAERRAQRLAAQHRADKALRAKPPPEARQHRREWPMQELLRLGPDDGGIDANEFEAALQIVEAFKILTADADMRGVNLDGMPGAPAFGRWLSDGDAERCARWFDWSSRMPRNWPARLVAQVEDREPVSSVAILRWSCRLWERIGNERRKSSTPCGVGLDATPSDVVAIDRRHPWPNSQIDARAGFLTVQRFSPPAGVLAHAMPFNPFLANASRAVPPSGGLGSGRLLGVDHADTTASAPAARLRR